MTVNYYAPFGDGTYWRNITDTNDTTYGQIAVIDGKRKLVVGDKIGELCLVGGKRRYWVESDTKCGCAHGMQYIPLKLTFSGQTYYLSLIGNPIIYVARQNPNLTSGYCCLGSDNISLGNGHFSLYHQTRRSKPNQSYYWEEFEHILFQCNNNFAYLPARTTRCNRYEGADVTSYTYENDARYTGYITRGDLYDINKLRVDAYDQTNPVHIDIYYQDVLKESIDIPSPNSPWCYQ